MLAYILLANIVFWKTNYVQSQEWMLERGGVDDSRVVFKNTTVTGDFMLCSWMWKDSLGGVWDTRIRLSLRNDSYKGGGFDYRDGYGRELLHVRWYQSAFQNLTWKSLFSSKFPPTPWNLSGYYFGWGYKPINEQSWNFFIDSYTIEPKPLKVTNPLSPPAIEELIISPRKKRSTNLGPRMEAFSIMDLFSGDGMLSQLPQLLINLFSFFTSLFPSGGGSGDYEAPNDEATTEPEAEVITKATTPTITSVVSDALSKIKKITPPML